MTTVKNIYDYINSFAPFEKQEGWDNSGFLVGDVQQPVKKCVVTLDVTKEVVAFAEKEKADLIVSHHPVIFQKLKAVFADTLPYRCIRSGIQVISAHTNYDIAPGGINDTLAHVLALQKVVVAEDGCLRIGILPQPMDAESFATYVKARLSAQQIRYSYSSKPIECVAVCGGAGSDFIGTAMKEADAFVTGDASYHTLLDADQADFCLIAAGHYDTEIIGVRCLREQLADLFTDVSFLDPTQTHPIRIL